MHVVVQVTGATVVDDTNEDIRPDQGHVHLYLDNTLWYMQYSLTKDIPVNPGTYVLKAEFVANDHAPFNPRDWSDPGLLHREMRSRPMPRSPARRRVVRVAVAAAGRASSSPAAPRAAAPSTSAPGARSHVGVVLPLSGMPAELAGQERLGIQLAADLVNADGGVQGRQLVLDVRDLSDSTQAAAVVAQLKAEGAPVVVGSYASDLSMAVSSAAASAGLVYWESGAVADQLTGRGLPLVFRVGADGARLGANSAAFASTVLAPMLGRTAATLRVTIVAATDDYARSVADAAQAGIASCGRRAGGLASTTRSRCPDWPSVMTAAGRIPARCRDPRRPHSRRGGIPAGDDRGQRPCRRAHRLDYGAVCRRLRRGARRRRDWRLRLGPTDRWVQPGGSTARSTNPLRPLRGGLGKGERLRASRPRKASRDSPPRGRSSTTFCPTPPAR